MQRKAWYPKSPFGQFSVMFTTELISFFILVANTRAFTQANYFWTAVTDTIFSAQGFLLFKMMADDENARSWASGIGCTLGGTIGSLLSIYVTKKIFGQ
jgi:hypothetical protein